MSLIHWLIGFIRSEFRRLFAFGLIGLASLGMNVGFYAILSRWLWPSGPRTVEYALVNILVTWINYELNRHFTFQQRQSAGAIGRFALVALVAWGLNSALFWLGHEVLHFVDFWVIVANAFIVALFTFSSHKVFTFHEDPWRHFKKKMV